MDEQPVPNKAVRNFYWLPEEPTEHKLLPDPSPERHLGSMVAAGRYCDSCGVWLWKHGSQDILLGSLANKLDECPACRKPAASLPLAYCFTWTALKHRQRLEKLAAGPGADTPRVYDEDGAQLTAGQLLSLYTAHVRFETQMYCLFR